MNNCPSNIFEILLLLERYHQKCESVLGATDMNGLRSYGKSMGFVFSGYIISLLLQGGLGDFI